MEKALGLLKDGRDILFDIDWQGTQQLETAFGNDLVSIFILPPDMVELELEGKLNLDGEILDTRGIADIRASRPLEFIRL